MAADVSFFFFLWKSFVVRQGMGCLALLWGVPFLGGGSVSCIRKCNIFFGCFWEGVDLGCQGS